jgi:chromosome segregation ATPase
MKAARQSLKDIKAIAGFVKGLQALAAEIGELDTLDKAFAERQAKLEAADKVLADRVGKIAAAEREAGDILGRARADAEGVADEARKLLVDAVDKAQAVLREADAAAKDRVQAKTADLVEIEAKAARYRAEANSVIELIGRKQAELAGLNKACAEAQERKAELADEIEALRKRFA